MDIYMLLLPNRQVKPAVPAPPLDPAFFDVRVAFAWRWPCRQFLREGLRQ